jgi:hypothetical protein
MSKTVSGSDKPFDPETARLAAKVRRLMLISGATTMIAIGAVFAVIGYRVFKAEGSAPRASDATVMLPKGARVIGTAAMGDRLTVTIQIGDTTEIRTFDPKTLQPTGRLRFTNEP